MAGLPCVPKKALLFPGRQGGFLRSWHVCKLGSHPSEHAGEPA